MHTVEKNALAALKLAQSQDYLGDLHPDLIESLTLCSKMIRPLNYHMTREVRLYHNLKYKLLAGV